VHYSGHSTPLAWYGDAADSTTSEMFSVSRIASLTNAGKLPFLVSMTCLVGNFNNPYQRSLDETLLVTANTGTIASWSPVGKGATSGHDVLDHGLLDAIYTQNITAIGQATLMAKYTLAASASGNLDLLDSFVLLGDPALALPSTYHQFLPILY